MKTYLFVLLFSFSLTPAMAQLQDDNEVIITDLMFSENWFNAVEDAKGTPAKVFYLDLSLQKNKTFPKEILTFKNLERLYVPYNYWESIPNEIGTLSKLQILDISGNYYMNRLPLEGLKKLSNLREIIVKDHRLAAGELDKLRKALPNCKVVTE